MEFIDKNMKPINIGDVIVLDGIKIQIVSIFYTDEIGENCMLGQHIDDSLVYCILTKNNLSANYELV